jgi:hypothetical protein
LQGFDPLLTSQYKAAVERFVAFQTNRLFDVDPMNEAMLRRFGVRWLLTRNGTAMEAGLNRDSRFRKVSSPRAVYAAFEYLHAQPSWRFDGEARRTRWEAADRSFHVTSKSGGRFVLVEQYFPGWMALVDGKETALERVDGVFQSALIPPGAHDIQFRYAPHGLAPGAVVTLLGLAALGVTARTR